VIKRCEEEGRSSTYYLNKGDAISSIRHTLKQNSNIAEAVRTLE
jgi:hypothetical protein